MVTFFGREVILVAPPQVMDDFEEYVEEEGAGDFGEDDSLDGVGDGCGVRLGWVGEDHLN